MKQYVIDAFSDQLFHGNPAAVVPLEVWPDEAVMQSIAAENNLSETAFFIPFEDGFQLRWFTPLQEVNLCGHATLAAAHVLFHELGYSGESIRFHTRSGELTVVDHGKRLDMDFPVQVPQPCEVPYELVEGLGFTPKEVLVGEDYIAVLENEAQLKEITPDARALSKLNRRGVIATALGESGEILCRFFAPKFGIPEDPVTGSAYTQLVPYWSEQSGKCAFHCRQLSPRGGELWCQLEVDRVIISGNAVTYSRSELTVS